LTSLGQRPLLFNDSGAFGFSPTGFSLFTGQRPSGAAATTALTGSVSWPQAVDDEDPGTLSI